MRKLIRMFLTALAPALIAACMSTGSQNPPQSITLSITPDRLAPGGTATLTLRNGSEETVGYNLCASSLFRQAGADAWEPVPEDRFCTMELRTLPPGGARGARPPPPSPARAGRAGGGAGGGRGGAGGGGGGGGAAGRGGGGGGGGGGGEAGRGGGPVAPRGAPRSGPCGWRGGDFH